MQFYTAEVNFYDADLNDIETDYLAIGANGFSGAMEQITEYYGDDITEVTLKVVNYEHGFAIVSKETYETINKEANI